VLTWTDPAWLDDTHKPIYAQLARLNRRVAGPIEKPHVRSWSTVLRVPTDRGDAWFKANIPRLAYEARLLEILVRERPQSSPELLAMDAERGWMFCADAGDDVDADPSAPGIRLRNFLEGLPPGP
jgi:ribosomal protein S10